MPMPETQRLHALLIAADCYLPNLIDGGTYPSLHGCVRDVAHVEAFLMSRLGLPAERIAKLTSTNTGTTEPAESPEKRPTYANMVKALKDLTARAASGDQVYIHYSGHGGRTPTSIPNVKGAKALDESLVPIDIGDTNAQYLRDHELAKLLKDMVDKKLVVTIVLDSCHSGGATRGALRGSVKDVQVRGVSFIDRTPRPTASLVATQAELEAAWTALQAKKQAGTTRSLVMSDATGQEYTLLAACRPDELANEAAFEGHESNGALTYWLLDTLQQLGPGMTYGMVHNRVVAKVHSLFDSQIPVLVGDPGRVVFGSDQVAPVFSTLVLEVAADGKSVTLETGQALGVRPGAEFVIYAGTAGSLTRPEDRVARVSVTKIGSTTSAASVVESFGTRGIAQGDQAVLLGAASLKLVRKVRAVRRADLKPEAQEPALQAFEKAVPRGGWIELAQATEPADFTVALSDAGTEFVIADTAGDPIPNLRPALAAGDAASAAKLFARLAHLSKFRAARELENKDAMSPLRNKLKVTLLGSQATFDPASDTPSPTPFGRTGDVPTVHHGDWVFVKVENASATDLNVAVFDLQPDWGISQAYPRREAFDLLDAGGEPLVLPLCAKLPDGYDDGTDTIKVLATVGRADFRVLTLPALDQPPARGSMAKTRGDQSLLDGVLSALGADRPHFRNLEPAANPSEEWTTAQVSVRVVREKV
jgi:hypothetical protein